jgi:glycosyltransferase involved in cell wall biosynthesis
MKITFFISSSHGDVLQDLDWPENHPLGGSETAALRLAKELRNIGEDVQIITDGDQLYQHHCDVFVSLRVWQVFHEGLYPGKRNYLWCHDDSDLPFVQPLGNAEVAGPIYEKLDGVILMSTYAAQRWLSNLNVPLKKIIMTTNGIPLQRFQPHPSRLADRRPWAYYSSTPFRGLELLLLAWPHIIESVPDAQLHICSSMKIYDPDGKTDIKFSSLYEQAKSLNGVKYHGSLGQADLRNVAQQCRVLAYPSIFPETSCIAAMEAMASGCVVVSTALGALPETAWQNPLVPIVDGWLAQWVSEVIRILKDNKDYEKKALQNLAVSKYYDWNVVAKDWAKFLKR